MKQMDACEQNKNLYKVSSQYVFYYKVNYTYNIFLFCVWFLIFL